MAITLDGNPYDVDHKSYNPKMGIPKTAELGMTGTWLVVESLVKPKHYDLVLQCTTTDVSNLWASLAKGGLLDFTDEQGFHWNPLGSGGGYLNTGVFFSPGTGIDPQPISELGWSSKNRFLVAIKLTVADTSTTLV